MTKTAHVARNAAFVRAVRQGAILKEKGTRISSLSAYLMTDASDLLSRLADLLSVFQSTRPGTVEEEIEVEWVGLLELVTGMLDQALGYDDARWEAWLARCRTVKTNEEWRAEFKARGYKVGYFEGWLDPASLDDEGDEEVAS